MICDVCANTKATVHLTEIINDQVTKLNLCESCAKKKGAEMEQHFGIADLLQGLAEFGTKPVSPATEKSKCSECGMTYDDFKKIGRLGCGTCYASFGEQLLPLLKRIHGSNRYMGALTPEGKIMKTEPVVSKSPSAPADPVKKASPTPPISDNLELLKGQLKLAVESEQYEKAAQLRDKIRQMESR